MAPMEPVPETVEAIEALEDGGLLDTLVGLADRATEVVPDLLGVSITWREEQLSFTLVATAAEFAALDAVQYLSGGPCVEGALSEQVREFGSDDPLDEERWRLFAEASAALGVRSTLTLPLIRDGGVAGTANLYAGSRRAFVGHHDELAAIFGGWAPGAVTNADLAFSTRAEAARTPQRIRERQRVIDTAVEILVEDLDVDAEVAEERLRTAAALGGVAVDHLPQTSSSTASSVFDNRHNHVASIDLGARTRPLCCRPRLAAVEAGMSDRRSACLDEYLDVLTVCASSSSD
ncbi:hypothetical protein [Nocardioides pyridinolyticus]